MKIVAAVLVSFVVCASAPAADWDHDANIDAAVGEAVSTHRVEGAAGMERVVGACYQGVDGPGDADARLQRLEYCAGMDFAAIRLEATAADDVPDDAFFHPRQVMRRAGRIAGFVSDPVVVNQILRAWSSTAFERLDRLGID